MIDKILDLEKFETGKQTIYQTENNLITTIENAIKPLQQLIKNKNIKVYIEAKDSIFAFYDEDRIIQVITKLLLRHLDNKLLLLSFEFQAINGLKKVILNKELNN